MKKTVVLLMVAAIALSGCFSLKNSVPYETHTYSTGDQEALANCGMKEAKVLKPGGYIGGMERTTSGPLKIHPAPKSTIHWEAKLIPDGGGTKVEGRTNYTVNGDPHFPEELWAAFDRCSSKA